MTFEEEQDLRILSLLKLADNKSFNYEEFNHIMKGEDSSYVSAMEHERKLITHQRVHEKNEETGNYNDWEVSRYSTSVLGDNRYNSLVRLKSLEDKLEGRNKWNYIFTIIAAVAGVIGIAVAVIIYYLQQQ